MSQLVDRDTESRLGEIERGPTHRERVTERRERRRGSVLLFRAHRPGTRRKEHLPGLEGRNVYRGK